MKEGLSYCGRVVREHDPDRFLISMLMPPDVREALWALFAFNHEIAKTREVVSDTTLGHIRLQWWREAVGAVYEGKGVPEHEVVGPLAAVIRKYNLPQEHFETLLHAREFDLEGVAPAHLEGLLIYADHTSTPLMKLAMTICGDDPETEPVQPVAINYALAGILRAAALHRAQGRSFLPEGRGTPEAVKAVIEGGVTAGLRPQSRFLRLSDRLARICLKRVKALKYDVFSQKMAVPPLFLPLRMLGHGLLS